ncbi:hypothetical protein BG005_010063, partial [Podila minutissima]
AWGHPPPATSVSTSLSATTLPSLSRPVWSTGAPATIATTAPWTSALLLSRSWAISILMSSTSSGTSF